VALNGRGEGGGTEQAVFSIYHQGGGYTKNPACEMQTCFLFSVSFHTLTWQFNTYFYHPLCISLHLYWFSFTLYLCPFPFSYLSNIFFLLRAVPAPCLCLLIKLGLSTISFGPFLRQRAG